MVAHEQQDDTQPDTTTGTAAEGHKIGRTPLPKLQLAIIFLIQFTEPLTATVIYPFIIQAVRDTGITGGDETKTGYYAGIVESLFFFTETATVFGWGWLSDVIGRKPVLLLGPLGLTASMFGFGLSTTYWSLFVFRASQGIFNGNVGVSKTMIAEITDETNIGDAYALAPLNWRIGVTIGPLLGGLLSDPATRWPDLFGRSTFFLKHPYFLPSAVAGSIALLAFATSCIALKETRPRKNALRRIWGSLADNLRPAKVNEASGLLVEGSPGSYGASQTLENAPPEAVVESTRPPVSLLFTHSYILTVVNYGLYAFLDMGMSALIPLVYSTPIEYGGLGMDPYHIGVIMAALGVLTSVSTALFLGPVLRRFGPVQVFQFGITGFFVTYSALALACFSAKRAGRIDFHVTLAIVLQFAASILFSPCYASMNILVVRNAPSKEMLGAAQGAAQMVTSGARALAPATASSLFSLSISRHLAGGYAVYWIFIVLALVLTRASRYLSPSA